MYPYDIISEDADILTVGADHKNCVSVLIIGTTLHHGYF